MLVMNGSQRPGVQSRVTVEKKRTEIPHLVRNDVVLFQGEATRINIGIVQTWGSAMLNPTKPTQWATVENYGSRN